MWINLQREERQQLLPIILAFLYVGLFLPFDNKNTTCCLFFYLWIKRWRLKPELLYVSKDRTTQLFLTVNWWWISRNMSGELFLRHYISIIWWCWNTRDAMSNFKLFTHSQDNICIIVSKTMKTVLNIALLSNWMKCTIVINAVTRIMFLIKLRWFSRNTTDSFRATRATCLCCIMVYLVMINFKVSTSKVEFPLSEVSYYKIQLKVIRQG